MSILKALRSRKLIERHQRLVTINFSRNSSNGDEYQFLEKSKIPTMHFQKSMPRLPIPELEKTCDRYLNAQKPVLTEQQFSKTQSIVNKFKENEGKSLHEELKRIDANNKHTNYISESWFDMYLSSRTPVVLNYNPFIGFNDDPNQKYNTQVLRASNLLISALRFLKSLKAQLLQPEVYHMDPAKSDNETYRNIMRLLPKAVSWYGAYLYNTYPLDMSHYTNLFNSTRIPHHGKDELLRDESATHVVALRNGNFYVFDVLDRNGNVKEPSHIHGCIDNILKDPRPAPEYPLGLLTSEDRDTWADLRQHLVNAGNVKTLRLIDTAVFALVLDEEPITDEVPVQTRALLHGNGINRWFDKSFQLIVGKNGRAGVNFEHAWGDGIPILRFVNEIYKDTRANHWVHPDSKPAPDGVAAVQCLEFKLDPTIKSGIDAARKRFDEAVKSMDVNYLIYTKMNRPYMKKEKISPDSFIQLAFQMGGLRLHGKVVPTYESCSTAAFKHGRTETIRPATAATRACSEAFLSKDKYSPAQLRSMIQECSTVHNRLTKEAAMGQGFDRHLFALRLLAQSKGGPMPAIFQDEAYAYINHIIISTSTLSSPAILIGGFGPPAKDCFAVSYAVLDDMLGFLVNTYPRHRDGAAFVECVHKSLEDLYEVVSKTSSSS